MPRHRVRWHRGAHWGTAAPCALSPSPASAPGARKAISHYVNFVARSTRRFLLPVSDPKTGRQRARATHQHSSWRAIHATWHTMPCASRLVHHDRPQPCGQHHCSKLSPLEWEPGVLNLSTLCPRSHTYRTLCIGELRRWCLQLSLVCTAGCQVRTTCSSQPLQRIQPLQRA